MAKQLPLTPEQKAIKSEKYRIWARANSERVKANKRRWDEQNAEHAKEYRAQRYKDNQESLKADARRRRKEHPEKVRAAVDRWNAKNSDRRKETRKKWRESNIDKVKQLRRQEYARNKEAELESSRKWKKENPDRNKAISQRWQEANREKMKEVHRQWYDAHPHKGSEYVAKRRSRMVGAIVKDVDLEFIWHRDKGVCYLCGKAIDLALSRNHPLGLHYDHVIPLARGGAHSVDNIRPTHARCNLRKKTKLVAEINP